MTDITQAVARLVLRAQGEKKRTIPLEDLVALLVEAHIPDPQPKPALSSASLIRPSAAGDGFAS